MSKKLLMVALESLDNVPPSGDNIEGSIELNSADVVHLNVPLFIRLLEYAREDAKDDAALHLLTERLIKVCQDGSTVGMEVYDRLVGTEEWNADLSVEKMNDAEGEYGDVEYADVKNKKYPIDTEKHTRAAWSYINMPKNAEKYTAAELKTIKGHIKSAAKKYNIEISED